MPRHDPVSADLNREDAKAEQQYLREGITYELTDALVRSATLVLDSYQIDYSDSDLRNVVEDFSETVINKFIEE